ncbi:MAG: FHA domain-containing protein [Victivallaceae bacterium]|nr:FHA domain-containing protein [Victivallaceae bacterium]
MAVNPKLTVLKHPGKTFELDKDMLTAGRNDNMDLCIKDATMSGHHCDFIRAESGDYVVRDNNSTNGTKVNNLPVTEVELKNSDIVQLGGVEMLYDAPGGTRTVTDITHTIEINGNELTNLSTVRELDNFSPFLREQERKQATANKVIFAVVGALILVVAGLLVWLVWMILSKMGTPAS